MHSIMDAHLARMLNWVIYARWPVRMHHVTGWLFVPPNPFYAPEVNNLNLYTRSSA